MAGNKLPAWMTPVQFPDLERLARPGVYFLHREGRVVYVGQATDMRRRIGQHISEGMKKFDAISFAPCTVGQLLKHERQYIEQLVPEYNKCGLSNLLRTVCAPSTTQPQIERYLTDHEAAEFLRMSPDEFKVFCRSKEAPTPWRIPRKRCRRYRLSDLERISTHRAAA